MNKRKKIYSVFSFLLAGTLCLSMAACGGTPTPAEDETTSSAPLSGALPVKALQPKHVDENPYMAKSDANIHHDGYNTDSTDEILPLGIYPEINVSFETTNPNASPAIYFDNYGHAVVPLLGGIAIRVVQRSGFFPACISAACRLFSVRANNRRSVSARTFYMVRWEKNVCLIPNGSQQT